MVLESGLAVPERQVFEFCPYLYTCLRRTLTLVLISIVASLPLVAAYARLNPEAVRGEGESVRRCVNGPCARQKVPTFLATENLRGGVVKLKLLQAKPGLVPRSKADVRGGPQKTQAKELRAVIGCSAETHRIFARAIRERATGAAAI